MPDTLNLDVEVSGFDAFLFDLDGVLTPTADVHMRAWSKLFTEYLDQVGAGPAYTDADYFEYIDGKPRYEGVASFLASRGIDLPEGDPGDSPDAPTVCGLGNRKNDAFNEVLAQDGVQAYPGSLRFLAAAEAAGIAVAVVSSSKNADTVLSAAGIRDRFEVVVDGVVAAQQGLPGKPEPDTYVYAARLLDVPIDRAVVIEDAISGVQAGRAGHFGLVLGVDRGVGRDALTINGADLVVGDLGDLIHPTK